MVAKSDRRDVAREESGKWWSIIFDSVAACTISFFFSWTRTTVPKKKEKKKKIHPSTLHQEYFDGFLFLHCSRSLYIAFPSELSSFYVVPRGSRYVAKIYSFVREEKRWRKTRVNWRYDREARRNVSREICMIARRIRFSRTNVVACARCVNFLG